MTLSEFIKKRLAEMGKNKNWLVNFGDVEWGTLSNIDKGRGISKATQEKLANALGCTQGDIQACLAEQNPLKNVIVNKKSLAKLNAKKEAPAPDPKDEEPAEVFQLDESNVDMMFPEEPEKEAEEDEEQAEYTLSEVKTFEQMALNDYKQHLRELAWRIFLSGVPGTHTMENIYADIGYALVQELGIKKKGGDTE